MAELLERMKNGFRRTADRMAGRHVPVTTDANDTESLDDRPLQRPRVDVLENGDELLLRVDVPGAIADTTRVRSDAGRLTIRARTGGDFDWYRAFTLPEHVDPTDARPRVERGVLSLHLPKRSHPAPQTIPVTSAD